MDELVKEFIVESYENLDRLDSDFVALEIDPTSQDKLQSIFRTIHTIKGTSGCLGMGKLESVAHVGENLLSRLREGELIIDQEITTGLLRLVDAVREILGFIETTGAEGDKEYKAVCETLVRLNARPNVNGAGVSQITESAPAHDSEQAADHDEPHVEAQTVPAEPVGAPVPVENTPVAAAPEESDEAVATDGDAPIKERRTDSVAGNAIRVDVILLDKLMNLVGELVLARNQVLQYNAVQKDTGFLGTAQRLNLITSELQEGVMKTRMQPIGNLWNKFPRIVRDVANGCKKKVRLEMEGKETELDKTIIEAIKDPLTHILRNSIDHGVETPEKRLAAGKPEEGCIHMRAFHEGGQVNIEIKDNGKGIDPEVIKRKALERGLITADQAARMNERDATALIFLPGFSTAEKITNVSGRGVGMDVVKTNVEKIGGTVDVKSKLGEGTTLRIKIPLTLAIIPALIVTSGGERFAIPQVSLLELVRLEENEAGIEMINGTPLYRLRGNLLPLVYLNRELKIVPTDAANVHKGASNIVVLRGGERQFGLVVDQINDTEEIVVKPLGKQLKGITVFAGATIMGDGRVALILDVMGVAQKANILNQTTESAVRSAAAQDDIAAANRQMLLLFKLNSEERMAIPLSAVARLEEFAWASVEDAGGTHVVQYRGQIMPLINVAEVLGDRRANARTRRVRKQDAPVEKIQVVVYSHNDRNIGLRVERILDVVDVRVDVQQAGSRAGVFGTAVIKDKVTELLDVEEFVRSFIATETAKAA